MSETLFEKSAFNASCVVGRVFVSSAPDIFIGQGNNGVMNCPRPCPQSWQSTLRGNRADT